MVPSTDRLRSRRRSRPGDEGLTSRRVLVRVLGLAVLIGGLVVVGQPALACSCVPMDLESRLPDAAGAFVGTYVDRHSLSDQEAALTFEVERVIKGEFGPTAIVLTNAYGGSCGIELLDAPRTGLLLEQGHDGVWESSLCQQVSPQELLAFADDGHPPDPAVAPIGAGWSSASKVILVAVFMLGTAASFIWWARRRRSLSA